MTYKFENAHEWLENHIERLHNQPGDLHNVALFNIAMALAREVDADTIQELFERLMDADGYFDEVVVA